MSFSFDIEDLDYEFAPGQWLPNAMSGEVSIYVDNRCDLNWCVEELTITTTAGSTSFKDFDKCRMAERAIHRCPDTYERLMLKLAQYQREPRDTYFDAGADRLHPIGA
jgi:hypothetical protein